MALAPRQCGAGLFSLFGSAPTRTRRIGLALTMIVVLSVADLAFTLMYLRSIGMSEMNPMARLVIEHNSPTLLAAWKAATVLVACTLLWMLRTRRSAEVGAWLGFAVLAALTVWWIQYTNELPSYSRELTAAAGKIDCPNWVAMPN